MSDFQSMKPSCFKVPNLKNGSKYWDSDVLYLRRIRSLPDRVLMRFALAKMRENPDNSGPNAKRIFALAENTLNKAKSMDALRKEFHAALRLELRRQLKLKMNGFNLTFPELAVFYRSLAPDPCRSPSGYPVFSPLELSCSDGQRLCRYYFSLCPRCEFSMLCVQAQARAGYRALEENSSLEDVAFEDDRDKVRETLMDVGQRKEYAAQGRLLRKLVVEEQEALRASAGASVPS